MLLVLRTVALAKEASRLGSNRIKIPLWKTHHGQYGVRLRSFNFATYILPSVV